MFKVQSPLIYVGTLIKGRTYALTAFCRLISRALRRAMARFFARRFSTPAA